jgi:[acyl-carrier-protein] S-malonyltransferase
MEKIAFVFPGQGAQSIGMGKAIYDKYRIVKQTFEETNDILGYDLSKICFEGSMSKLNSFENLFPALLTLSIAYYRVYMKEIGIKPVFCAGHSLGEYAALTCAGAINFADAVKITYRRGILAKDVLDKMDAGMTIIDGVYANDVQKYINQMPNSKDVSISCYNAIDQVAISGKYYAVQAIEDLISDACGSIAPLFGSAPFHCSCMKESAVKFEKELEQYTFNKLRYPVISNVTGKMYESEAQIKELLVKQLTYPVQWQKTIEYFDKYGISMIVEMGPKNMLINLIKKNYKDKKCICFDKKEDRFYLKENIADSTSVFERFITKCLRAAITTPNLNRNNEEYKKGVLQPIAEIKKILGTKDNDYEDLKNSIKLLKTVFNTKHINEDEQKYWINEIVDETGLNYPF